MKNIETLAWIADPGPGHLRLIDQTLLPTELREIDCHDVATVWEAIKSLRVRGAPAIGIAAAYGVCIGIQPLFQDGKTPSLAEFHAKFDEVVAYLASSRPTAVNLFWALDRMRKSRGCQPSDALTNNISSQEMTCGATSLTGRRGADTPRSCADRLLTEAMRIHEEDRTICRAIGRYGAELVRDGDSLLTHCNAGGLATADYGTALAVFFAAAESGKRIHVFADETRPLLQGARLTAWELKQRGIPVTLLCDSMAALVMRQGKVNAVFVGADRIAANGDTANKIGTYGVAVAAKHHNVPFYVAAPVSTFDLTLSDGDGIPIEERDPCEVSHGFGRQTAPDGIAIYNPAFDVTPADLIAGIITEKGVISPVTTENVRKIVCSDHFATG